MSAVADVIGDDVFPIARSPCFRPTFILGPPFRIVLAVLGIEGGSFRSVVIAMLPIVFSVRCKMMHTDATYAI